MKKITSSALKVFLALLLLGTVQKNCFAFIFPISNTINGAQEVPPVTTSGTGTITGTYNSATKVISYTVTFSNLTGTSSAGHFHGPATITQTAGVQIGFSNIPLGVTGGTFSNSNTLSATQETQLLNGLWYANIHSSFQPGGEIRGQITLLQTLNLTYLIEGLYDNISNTMVADTVTVNLRNSTSPFAVASTSKTLLNTSGKGVFSFAGVVNGTGYYIQVLHRNGLETWNASPVSFISDSLNYDFTTASSQAFGNNLKLKGTKYCAFSGDVSPQDGTVDLSDIILIYNDAGSFASGYIPTDVNGDNFADLSDVIITFNNATNFVNAVRP